MHSSTPGLFFEEEEENTTVRQGNIQTPSAQGTESVLRHNSDQHREELLSPPRPSHGQGVVCQGGKEERGLLWVAVGRFWADGPLDSARCSTSH